MWNHHQSNNLEQQNNLSQSSSNNNSNSSNNNNLNHFGGSNLTEIQQIEKSLDLGIYINYLKNLFSQEASDSESSDGEFQKPFLVNHQQFLDTPEQNFNSVPQNFNSSQPSSKENSNSSVASNVSTLSSFNFSQKASSSSSSFSSSNESTTSSSLSQSDDSDIFMPNVNLAQLLPPISDKELKNLLKAHESWKKSNSPLGSREDITNLFGIKKEEFKRDCNIAVKKESRQSFNEKEIGEGNFDDENKSSKNRSRKQSLKNIRSEVQQQQQLLKQQQQQQQQQQISSSSSETTTTPNVTLPSTSTASIPVEPTLTSSSISLNAIKSEVIAPNDPILPETFLDENLDQQQDTEEEDNESLSDFLTMTANAPSSAPTMSDLLNQNTNGSNNSTNNDDINKNLINPVSPSSSCPPLNSSLKFPTSVSTTSSLCASPSTSSSSATTPSTTNSLSVDKKKKDIKTGEIIIKKKSKESLPKNHAKMIELFNLKRKRLYILLCKKEIGKTQRSRANTVKENLVIKRRLCQACSRQIRQKAIQSQKAMKESVWRAKRLTREMQAYWKQADRVEREVRKKREKEAEEQRKQDVEIMEVKRQQRKLNFLITQTELYAHFMSKKLGDPESLANNSNEEARILSHLNEEKDARLAKIDDYDCEIMKDKAKANVDNAFKSQLNQVQSFSFSTQIPKDFKNDLKIDDESRHGEWQQPKMFEGLLKCYQLKGMNWLVNLYDQGINGILADEMGLGKTVQAIAFLAHIAEEHRMWGPFLVIAPASTLHNWQQEFKRFVPNFTTVPYWGSLRERKILRQFWQQSNLHTKEASFHVVITSYQIVVADLKYFNRIKWLYLILDEAQAIKSTASARWKMLLGFSCRNRLLLTGTPIQNTMGELWALLHFIMPSLFDSHEEFNEWFSKDIESHAENKSLIDEKHLSRLHMILKPFMLRRIKKDVENELSDKIEILQYCPLSFRQKFLYTVLKKKIKIEDLLKSAGPSNSQLVQHATTNLMNLVMQFRKVCNHPDLFERREVKSPFRMNKICEFYPKLIYEDGILSHAFPSKKHLLENKFSVFNPIHLNNNNKNSKVPSFSKDIKFDNNNFSDEFVPFLNFIGLSLGELNEIIYGGIISRWKYILKFFELIFKLYQERTFNFNNFDETGDDEKEKGRKKCFLNKNDLILTQVDAPLSIPNLQFSPNLNSLIIVSNLNSSFYTYSNHFIYSTPETIEHRTLRSRTLAAKLNVNVKTDDSNLTSDELILLPEIFHFEKKPEIRNFQRTYLPPFLNYMCPIASTPPRDIHISSRSASWWFSLQKNCSSREGFNFILNGTLEEPRINHFTNLELGGLRGINPIHGWSNLVIPDKEKLVFDSGKLSVLDNLLKKLKSNNHRVLIYSQMTRMIDLLEEYMWNRKWTYIRLDGSSKISERRDMVADFQSRSDIFVFLLSTRAGGLGINLTAADTVIFYDSDWNPTVDQQAMDRAHRLGQTKQVTVYRLICKGTIEERILERAREKNEIQRMVISGENFRTDTLKPKEVVSLLLDDEELEKKYRQKQAERKIVEEIKSDKNESNKEEKISLKRKVLVKQSSPILDKEKPGSSSQMQIKKQKLDENTGILTEEGKEGSPGSFEGSEKDHDSPITSDVDCELEGEQEGEEVCSSNEDSFIEGEEDDIKTGVEWNELSDFDDDGFSIIPKRQRLSRGTGKRGRPPSRIRVQRSPEEGDSIRRGPGRPRLRPIGPLNQGARGRRPGRPPLSSKKTESLSSSLTPLTTSQRVFGFYSSPDLDLS